jgi:hypothetical protein
VGGTCARRMPGGVGPCGGIASLAAPHAYCSRSPPAKTVGGAGCHDPGDRDGQLSTGRVRHRLDHQEGPAVPCRAQAGRCMAGSQQSQVDPLSRCGGRLGRWPVRLVEPTTPTRHGRRVRARRRRHAAVFSFSFEAPFSCALIYGFVLALLGSMVTHELTHATLPEPRGSTPRYPSGL